MSDMLNFSFLAVILDVTNSFILANICYIYLIHICHVYKHCVFGERMIFLGHRVSYFQQDCRKKLWSLDLNYFSLKSVFFVLVRPSYRKSSYPFTIHRWLRSLRTMIDRLVYALYDKAIGWSDSFFFVLVRHVAVFERDLFQLFEQLKELTFLDISGKIDYVKIDPYHKMARTCFPNSRIDVEMSRFRLWRWFFINEQYNSSKYCDKLSLNSMLSFYSVLTQTR